MNRSVYDKLFDELLKLDDESIIDLVVFDLKKHQAYMGIWDKKDLDLVLNRIKKVTTKFNKVVEGHPGEKYITLILNDIEL